MSQLEGFYQQSYSNSPLNSQQQHSYPQQQQQQQHHQQQGFYGSGQSSAGSQGFSQFYNNNQNQFQQQQFQHQRPVPPQHQPQQSPAPNQFGGLPNGVGSANDMMQSPFPQQQRPMGTSNQTHPFTSAGYPQSIPATSGTPRPQGFPQGTASPSHTNPSPSPHVANQSLGQSAHKTAMGAPATPQASQGYQQQQQQSPHGSVKPPSQPQSPSTAVSPAIEKERIGLMLEINIELLQEIHNLQSQGKGGAQNTQQAEQFRLKGLPDTIATPEYLQTLLRLHANLGYCCAQSDMQTKPGAKAPHPPSYMRAPPSMPSLEPKYARLRQLFPGWVGKDGQAGSAPSPVEGNATNNHNGTAGQQQTTS